MDKKILDIIRAIEADNLQRRVLPRHALVKEVKDMGVSQSDIDRLVEQKIIILGKSINDNYITIL